MAIFDRFGNPTWYAISVLPEKKKLEIARVIVVVGGWRVSIKTFFIKEFLERIQAIYGRAVSTAEIEIITSHASLAILKCSSSAMSAIEREYKLFSADLLETIFERLLCAELDTIDKRAFAPYSADGEVAKVQFFSNCARLLAIQDINFSQQMTLAVGEQWRTIVASGLRGIAKGMQRSALEPDFAETTLAKAKVVCKEFSPNGQAIILAMAEKLKNLPN